MKRRREGGRKAHSSSDTTGPQMGTYYCAADRKACFRCVFLSFITLHLQFRCINELESRLLLDLLSIDVIQACAEALRLNKGSSREITFYK